MAGNKENVVVCAVLIDNSETWGFRFCCLDDGTVKDVKKDIAIKAYKMDAMNFLNAKVVSDFKKNILGNYVKDGEGNKVPIEVMVGERMSFNSLPHIYIRKKPTDPTYLRMDTKNNLVYAEKNLGENYKLIDYGGKIISLSGKDFNFYRSNLVNLDPLIDNTLDLDKIVSTPLDARTSTFKGDTTGMGVVSGELRAKTEQMIKEKEKSKDKLSMIGAFALASGDDNYEETENGNIYRTFDNGFVLDFEGDSALNDYRNKDNMGAGYKLANAMLYLRNLNYFYYSLLQELNRKLLPADCKEIRTMAVSPSTLYVNVGFVDELSLEEITFVLMHESMHILFRHNYYGIGKNQDVHNVATDLIINKTITDEYGCLPGNKFPTRVSTAGGSVGIKFVDKGLWLEAIDTTVDTSESVYHELMTAIEKQAQKMGKFQGNQGSQSQGTQGNSQGSQGQSQGTQGNSQGSQGQSQGNSQGSQGQSQGNSQGSQGIFGNGMGQSGDPYDIDFRGTKITIQPEFRDIVLSKEDAEKGKDGIGDKTTQINNRAEAACKMAGKEISPLIQATLKIESVIVRPRWQKVLKEFLAKLGENYYTYSAINKRYIHRHLIVPGPKQSEENSKKLSNIVLAIDTSGSMFDEETLSKIVSLASSIVKKYNADGEIIYWDTSVTSTGRFKDKRTLARTKVTGGGGTDINCLFEYLDKQYPNKNNKPSLVMVMTDGYFGTLKDTYVKRYKNVIWAIPEDDLKSFKKPENGKVAMIEMNK